MAKVEISYNEDETPTGNSELTTYVYDGGVNVMDINGILNNQTTPSSLKTVSEGDYNIGNIRYLILGSTRIHGGIGSVLYSERVSKDQSSTPEEPRKLVREYYLYNAIGSTVALTNDAGAITSTTSYEAFGKEVASSGETDNDRKFCTKERSESIGLDNFGFRYFDWELGRFLTRVDILMGLITICIVIIIRLTLLIRWG